MNNRQKPEPFVRHDYGDLDVHSIFYTIQGEGPFTGYPAIFIRLAGCNLQCPGCDTDYTTGRHKMSTTAIVNEIIKLLPGGRSVVFVITGGEPLRQNIDDLITILIDLFRFPVQIESNGVFGITERLCEHIATGALTFVCSPKTSRVHHTMKYANVFKYVLSTLEIDNVDGLPLRALGHKASPRVARPPNGYLGKIYVNPMDEGNDEINQRNLLTARNSAFTFGYVLGIQLHKLVQLP